ncbi:MAG: type IV secretory system conjugative DNA transfer family protein [Pseudomonadota bacterium]
MSQQDTRRFWVNRYALASAASGALASLARPQPGDYIGQYPIYGILALCTVLFAAFTMRGLINRYRRRKMLAGSKESTGTLGDARFTSLSELHAAGLTDPASGHLLCTVNGVPIFAPRQTHHCLQGPPGSGKSTSIAVNAIAHLAHLGSSLVVQDIKPELVHIIAPELERRGFRIVVNDVAGLSGHPHTDSNPFQILVDEVTNETLWPRAFITAEGFAFQLRGEPENDSKNRYFRDLERGLFVVIATGLAALAPELCIPSVIWRTAADPGDCLRLLNDAAKSDVLHGDLAAQARNYLALMQDHPEHFEGARTGLAQSLSAFRPSSELGMVGTNHEFHPMDLRDETKPPIILFDVVPSASLETYGKAIALQQYARLTVLKRVPGRRVAFCMDECTNLAVNQLAKDITLLRSRGIVLMLLYQSISELKRVYGEKAAATITANSIEQFLQVSDSETAELISRRIGDHTVRTSSYSYSTHDGSGSVSSGEQATKVMPPDEVLAMGKEETLVFVPGLRPIRGQKIPYFHIDPIKHWAAHNPHEPYRLSPITQLTIAYGKDAADQTPPSVPGLSKNLKTALKREAFSRQSPRVSPIELRSTFFIPIVIGAYALIQAQGTPHVLFEYQTQPDASGHSRCVYLGPSGVRPVRVQGSCSWVKLLKPRTKDGGPL